jgi:hypothetical protein
MANELVLKRILVAESKHVTRYFDASTPEMEDAAYKKLFDANEEDGWYEYFESISPEDAKDRNYVKQYQLYRLAKTGDLEAVKALLKARKDYEYEGYRLEEVL